MPPPFWKEFWTNSLESHKKEQSDFFFISVR